MIDIGRVARGDTLNSEDESDDADADAAAKNEMKRAVMSVYAVYSRLQINVNPRGWQEWRKVCELDDGVN